MLDIVDIKYKMTSLKIWVDNKKSFEDVKDT